MSGLDMGNFSGEIEGGSGCDLAHLLGAVLLQGGLGMDLPSSGEIALTMR